MKNVLLVVHDDDGQAARLEAALDLTRSLGGHLSCLDVIRVPEFVRDYVDTAAGLNLELDERDRAKRNRERLQDRLQREDVNWDWTRETGDIADIVNNRIGLSDIVVLNSDLQDHLVLPDMRAITTQVALRSRKPVLAVPETHLGFTAAGRAVVAWDGSAPCIAALQAATPILSLASAVFIVEIDFRATDANKPVSAQDAATYLSRHGISADIKFKRTQGIIPIANILLDTAQELRADYMLAGAYGHSPLKEAILGGVSRALLTRTRIPLLLAH